MDRDRHFESVESFLQYLDETMTTRYDGENRALDYLDIGWRGPKIPEFLQDCRTLGGEFPQLITRVQTLVNQLAPVLPPTPSVKRMRTWGKQGSSINPHRVLRGQLSTAWRKTRRDWTASYQGVVSLVIPTLYAGAFDQDTIAWMAAVPLALAQVIEASGRRTEVWGLCYSARNTWLDHRHLPLSSLVRLKAAEGPWSLHGPVFTIHPAFTRRLVFRLMETLGPVNGTYGNVSYTQEVFDQHACHALAAFAGVPASRVLCGPWPMTHPIDSADAAVRWLSDTLSRLNTHHEEVAG